ncbi:MAG: RsmD family RNA methyltransferase [Myxococcales bacterium]|nr:RsmD family RNA methyltransferase [Myxococcales bacterium]
MRIVGGELSGRVIEAPVGRDTRPTSDRVREGIAGALAARGAIEGAAVLDLFAGSGALGFEVLSRGAARLLCLDSDRRALRCIERNAASLGLTDRTRVVKLDLAATPARIGQRIAELDPGPFSLVFADPPYADIAVVPALLAALVGQGLLTPGAFVAIEHPRGQPPATPEGFEPLSSYRYGDTGVALWQSIA